MPSMQQQGMQQMQQQGMQQGKGMMQGMNPMMQGMMGNQMQDQMGGKNQMNNPNQMNSMGGGMQDNQMMGNNMGKDFNQQGKGKGKGKKGKNKDGKDNFGKDFYNNMGKDFQNQNNFDNNMSTFDTNQNNFFGDNFSNKNNNKGDGKGKKGKGKDGKKGKKNDSKGQNPNLINNPNHPSVQNDNTSNKGSNQNSSERRFRGKIKNFSARGGYGFISSDETQAAFGRDVFIHSKQMSEVLRIPLHEMQNFNNDDFNLGLEFAVHINEKGMPQARECTRIDDGSVFPNPLMSNDNNMGMSMNPMIQENDRKRPPQAFDQEEESKRWKPELENPNNLQGAELERHLEARLGELLALQGEHTKAQEEQRAKFDRD